MTKLHDEMKEWIDNATYQELLYKWRFAKIGSTWFSGEIGEYYNKVMAKKRKETTDAEHTAASKAIGWGE